MTLPSRSNILRIAPVSCAPTITEPGVLFLQITALVGIWILGFGISVHASTLHISPAGNDAWSGRLQQPNAARTDGPVASLAGARDAVRKLKATSRIGEPINVFIADGSYSLIEPIT